MNRLMIFHLDLNYVCLTGDQLRILLTKVAGMGYNAVLWEVENKIRWETCPECVWPEAMSKDEFRALLHYSRSLGLEPIPLLQTFGHGEYVLQHEAYHAFRENPTRHDCYCTSNPDVRQFLRRWIREYLELFGELHFFHFGGDEAYVFGSCPICSPRTRNDLYAEHINALAEELLPLRIRPGIWCDMIMHYPEQVDFISRDFVIWDWNYWDGLTTSEPCRVTPEQINTIPEATDKNGMPVPFYRSDFLKRKGYDVILCSASRSAGESPFLPAFATHWRNIIGAARKAAGLDLLGHCVTSWAIRLNDYEVQWPLLEMAPESEAHPELSPDEILQLVCQRHFGSAEAVKALEAASAFDSFVMRMTGVQWNHLKDSLPPPQGYLKKYIAELVEKNNASWHKFPDTLKRLAISIEEGREGLECLPQNPMRDAWHRRSKLQWQFCRVCDLAFGEKSDHVAARRELNALRPAVEHLFMEWQTPLSAAHNTALLCDPLLEYLC